MDSDQSRLQLDEIGYWSEVKLDIIRKYAAAYSMIMSKRKFRGHLYIDAFAGAGEHISRSTGANVQGSPLIAIDIDPPFTEIHLIDLDGARAKNLRSLGGSDPRVHVYEDDCNTILIDKIFPRCRYDEYRRALCLLDPYKLNLSWKVLEEAGRMRSVEIFFNFMIMDANRNVLYRDPERVSDDQQRQMDFVWGDRSWRAIAYKSTPGLFGDMEEKLGNAAIASAFRDRLHQVAGFKYVPEPMPMRNSKGAVVYYLFFAGPNETGAKIVEEIFAKYSERGLRDG